MRYLVVVTLLLLLSTAGAHAHGVHANFVSPDEGAVLRDQMVVHVKKPAAEIPYIHISVWQQSSGKEVWSGLVPVGKDGYVQDIELANWKDDEYSIVIQFLGDPIQEKTKRMVKISSS